MLIITEIGGGHLLIAGALTPLIALVSVVNMLGAIVFVHAGNGTFVAEYGHELATILIAALVPLALLGAGRYSVDGVVANRPPPERHHARAASHLTLGLLREPQRPFRAVMAERVGRTARTLTSRNSTSPAASSNGAAGAPLLRTRARTGVHCHPRSGPRRHLRLGRDLGRGAHRRGALRYVALPKDGGYLLPLKEAERRPNELGEGDDVAVEMTPLVEQGTVMREPLSSRPQFQDGPMRCVLDADGSFENAVRLAIDLLVEESHQERATPRKDPKIR